MYCSQELLLRGASTRCNRSKSVLTICTAGQGPGRGMHICAHIFQIMKCIYILLISELKSLDIHRLFIKVSTCKTVLVITFECVKSSQLVAFYP